MGNEKNLRLVVLVSGGGTNLQAMLDRMHDGSLSASVVAVVSDRRNAYGLVRAELAGIPAHVVDYNSYLRGSRPIQSNHASIDLDELDRRQRILSHPDREERLSRLARLVRAEQELIGTIDRYNPDYVCLAGYMRLLTPFLISHYNREGNYRILNIHPALLPSFPGQHGYEDTFEYGSRWGGVTVHFVDEGEDSGPIIAQATYPIWPEDTIETIRHRGLQIEYLVYSQCLNWLSREQIRIDRCPDKRPRVVITDPSYRTILRSWIEASLSSNAPG